MIATVRISGMAFHAFHGCYAEEREKGGRYSVDVSLDADVAAAAENDDLNGTVNYEIILDIVKGSMEVPCNLIEHLGWKIFRAIQERFPEARNLEVTVHKLQPPLAEKTDETSVTFREM